MSRHKPFLRKLLSLALGVALMGAAIGAGVGLAIHSATEAASAESSGSLSSLAATAATSSDLDSPFKAVYDEVSQSTVGIQLNLQRTASYGRIETESAFVGSGVVIKEGYVVTNYHVVTAGGSSVMTDISVVYGDEVLDAKYVAGDEESDIAVLEVKDLTAPAVRLGNSDELSIGDWALVVGNPLGESFSNTLTVGVISGLNRDISSSSRVSGQTASSTELIQTDAAINSGNSGGGMYNIRGELIGITSSKMSNNGMWGSASIESIGLAIPINTVIRIADDLIDYGEVKYPTMGVRVQTMSSPSDEPTTEYLPASVWVREVYEDTPAERAGLQVNDLILEANGQRVRTNEELVSLVRTMNAGDTVELKVYRIPNLMSITKDQDIPEGEYLTVSVELEISTTKAE